MSEQTDVPLDYQGPPPERRRPPLIGGVIVGALGGALVSFLAYVRWFEVWQVVLIVLLMVKAGVGMGLMNRPASRGFGIGVLLSIGLGALIFFGVCAANFKL